MASKGQGDSANNGDNAAKNDGQRIVVIAVDASHTAEHAFDCKFTFCFSHGNLKS